MCGFRQPESKAVQTGIPLSLSPERPFQWDHKIRGRVRYGPNPIGIGIGGQNDASKILIIGTCFQRRGTTV